MKTTAIITALMLSAGMAGAQFMYPANMPIGTTGSSQYNVTIDDANNYIAMIITMPADDVIEEFTFNVITFVAAPTTCVVDAESVSSLGLPSGTLFNPGATASFTISGAGYVTGAFSTPIVVERGDIIAFVIKTTGSPNFNVANRSSLLIRNGTMLATSLNGGSSWSKATTAAPSCVIHFASGIHHALQGVAPFGGSVLLSTDTSPDERGIKFKFPYPIRIEGAMYITSGTGQTSIVVYDESDNVLASQVLPISAQGVNWMILTDAIDLAANQVCRIVVKPTTSTSCNLNCAMDGDSAITDGNYHWGWQGIGESTHRTDGGAWTDDIDIMPMISLLMTPLPPPQTKAVY